MELGIIGNCQFIALVNAEAEVSWLCWPRFDSSFVFGSLLDDDKGGCFRIGPPHGGKGEQDYLVNTNILRTVFQTEAGSFEVIDFAPRYAEHGSYYKPT